MDDLSHADVYEQVRSILGEVLGVDPETIRPENTVAGDLGAQSLDQAALVVALRHTFGRRVSASGSEELVTVMDIVNYIAEGTGDHRGT